MIEFRDVSKVYDNGTVALKDVNLRIDRGEFVFIVGASGAGKSTFLKTIMREEVPTSGSIMINNYDLTKMSTREIPYYRRTLGIVFQDFRLMPDRTVRQNLEFVLRATDWKRADEREQRIAEVLRMVRLEEALQKRPYELSGGEQQRIGIARALLNRPKLILADEPTGNLDNENGELILAILDEIRRGEGATVIMATHNPLWPQYFPGTVYHCAEGKMTRSDGQTASETI